MLHSDEIHLKYSGRGFAKSRFLSVNSWSSN